ncbi:MAG: M20/M25/M40 family metallo-hydrolase [Armatimonadota bacterium]|nr:M20/M25/M40 family metallo-hydrolase [Armatimonadota bacterium]MDR7453551.1 M20/M25/M40 family metallo-hydrolase [Armatimonadota bacterium]MDR7455689.1 M20/M25/M40 family metallo-hydrolase [Armatimonadota bacterium]MDR7497478.1 M20/M25/M40 family metallo-hydrolase [Armatimonadota bacterium]MDR7512535.1 M20/M25/M40 family metallo-hydrolase [Armatimonadota bacterium]
MDDLDAYLDAHADAHLERVRAYVRQPSISGEGAGMAEMAEMVADSIRRLGGAVEIVPTEGWPVVTGAVDAGRPRTLLLYGMYDVQPVEGEDWLVPPFAGEIVDLPEFGPSVVARGVYNTKGPLAGLFNVLEAFRATGGLPVNLKFVVEGEEELGSAHLPGFIERYRDRLGADATYFAFYCQDRRGRPKLWLGVKGIQYFEVTCRGGAWGGPRTRGVHGSNAVWVGSPAWRLLRALATMMDDRERITIDGFYDDVAPPSAEDEALLAELARTFDPATELWMWDAERFKHDAAGAELLRRYLYDPTLNIDGIWGGYTGPGMKTLLPYEVKVKMDVRLVPNMEPERVRARIRAHLERIGRDDIEVHFYEGYPPAKTSASEPAVQALIRACRALGYEPEVWPHLAGSAPFYLFRRVLGQPFVMGGLGHGGRPHSPNEYATVAGMRLFEKSVARFITEFAAA